MIIIVLIVVCAIFLLKRSNSPQPKSTNNTTPTKISVSTARSFEKTIGKNLAFERAFERQLGRDPATYVANKLDSGSDLDTIRYLFDIIAVEVEKKSNCPSPGFDFYYEKVLRYQLIDTDKLVKPKLRTVQPTSASGVQRHQWTVEEDTVCCRKFFEQYVVQQSSMDLQQFAQQLHRTLPSISIGSLRMKTQNIKQLCIEFGIRNSLDAKPLSQYSKQNYYAFLRIKKEFGFL